MRIITSNKLFAKYPGNDNELKNLLNAITPNVDILDFCDFLSVRQHIATMTEPIVIVGNDDVINFGRLPNPAQDSDTEVLSDNVYSCTTDPMYLIPSRVVSRIPDDAVNPDFNNIKNTLTNQAYWLKNKTTNTGWLNFVASVWAGTSTYMENEFQMKSQFIVAPSDKDIIILNGKDKKFIYGNTHGASTSRSFFGTSSTGYPVALDPAPGFGHGAVTHFCACYGGYTINRNTNDSIPMSALASGALGISCSTEISYGTSNAPIACSDLLAECFFKRILSGENLGLAFMHAKQDYASQTIKNQGSMSGAFRKTLLSFNLYGLTDIYV